MTQDDLRVALTEIKHYFVNLIRSNYLDKPATDTKLDKDLINVQRDRLNNAVVNAAVPLAHYYNSCEKKQTRSDVLKSMSASDKQNNLAEILASNNIDADSATTYQKSELINEYERCHSNAYKVFNSLENPNSFKAGDDIVKSLVELYPSNDEREAITIDQAFEMFLNKKSDLRHDSITEYKRYVDLFKVVMGADRNLVTLRRKDWIFFFDELFKFPTKQRKPFRNMSFQHIYDEYVKTNKYRNFKDQLYKAKSVEHVRKFFQGIYAHLVELEYMTDAEKPITKMAKSVTKLKDANRKKKAHFELNEVHSLLAQYQSEPELIRWYYTIIAYTGMRRDECMRIKKTNIRVDDETQRHYIAVTDSKSSAGIRKIPISHKLIKLGFLDFVKSSKYVYIFHIPNIDKRSLSTDKTRQFKTLDGLSTHFTKKVMPAAGVDKLDTLEQMSRSLHCWRHTIITHMQSKSPIHLIQQVVGHEQTRIGATSYYRGEASFAETLKVIDDLPW